jgi:hypothetical protein
VLLLLVLVLVLVLVLLLASGGRCPPPHRMTVPVVEAVARYVPLWFQAMAASGDL